MEVDLREHTYHEGPSPGSAMTCSLGTWGTAGEDFPWSEAPSTGITLCFSIEILLEQT